LNNHNTVFTVGRKIERPNMIMTWRLVVFVAAVGALQRCHGFSELFFPAPAPAPGVEYHPAAGSEDDRPYMVRAFALSLSSCNQGYTNAVLVSSDGAQSYIRKV
jgi:hypothetical protein